jgi:Kef-type K+ transport system membrane component KefB
MIPLIQAAVPPDAPITGALLGAYVLFDIFLIIVLARILGTIMGKIGQPRVVGEILAGVLLGPTLLGNDLSLAIAPEPARAVIGTIATMALILFMFLAGTEYDRSTVRGRETQASVLALLAVAVPALVAFPVAAVMHTPTFAGSGGEAFLPYALFLGAALAVTAFPVMAHILMERGELNTPIGGLGVATAAIMSVFMFLYLAFAAIVASATGMGALFRKLLLVALFVAASWLVVRPLMGRVLRAGFRHGAVSPNTMGIVFAGLILWGLLGDRLGIHAMVGAFLWGLLLPEDRDLRRALSEKVRDVALILFLPVFFAFSGFNTDLRLLTPAVIPATILFVAAAVGGKFLAVIPARAFGLSWNETGVLAALFNTRGLLALVAGLIGLQLQIITPATFTVFVVMSLATNLMTLPLLDGLARRRVAAEARVVAAPARVEVAGGA